MMNEDLLAEELLRYHSEALDVNVPRRDWSWGTLSRGDDGRWYEV